LLGGFSFLVLPEWSFHEIRAEPITKILVRRIVYIEDESHAKTTEPVRQKVISYAYKKMGYTVFMNAQNNVSNVMNFRISEVRRKKIRNGMCELPEFLRTIVVDEQ
jgi:hypothetical protein